MISDKYIYINDLKQLKDEIYKVCGVHFFPIRDQIDTSNGFLIKKEDFPIIDEEKKETMDHVLYYEKSTNKAYYEYIEREKTDEENEIEILKKQVADLYFMQLQEGTN